MGNRRDKGFFRSRQSLVIYIKLDGQPIASSIMLRHILAETLEHGGVGEVYYEGSGDDFVEVALSILYSEEKDLELRSLLTALGILECSKLTYKDLED